MKHYYHLAPPSPIRANLSDRSYRRLIRTALGADALVLTLLLVYWWS